MKTDEEFTELPCCGYRVHALDIAPVYWNQFNKVVQCHNCGHTYLPMTELSNDYGHYEEQK